MVSPEVQEFFAALQSDDLQVVDSLLNEVDPSLRRIIRARLNDARVRRIADTSDIVQSLLRDFLSRKEGRSEPSGLSGDLYAYLGAAACHKIQAKLRKERRLGGSLADDLEPASSEPGAIERLENLDFTEVVRNQLRVDCRLLFDLSMQGLTWPEISTIVGGQPDALRMRMRRGIASVLADLREKELSHVG